MALPRHHRLHLFALSGFAVAQPLYDLIGKYAEFLVAHRAGAWTIAALMAVLSLAIPLALVIVVDAARLASERLAGWVQEVFAGLLTALVAANAVRSMPTGTAFAVAAVAGVLGAFAYRLSPARLFLTILSPAAIVFPLVFATATPVSRLLWSRGIEQQDRAFARRPPIVVAVFDEMSTFTMLGPDGRIDGERYPNLAALAGTSTWFPNAVSPYPYTMFAIPAIVSGQAPDSTKGLLPVASDYPDNLFNWLGRVYDLHVAEPITALCPPAFCGAATDADRGQFAADLAVLYLHLVAPHDFAASHLPSLGSGWKGFDSPTIPQISADERSQFRADVPFNKAAEAGRDTAFRAFVAGVQRSDRPSLHFVHSLLPHDPYQYFASGHLYAESALTGGIVGDNVWHTDPWIVETGRERHIEQERFADKLLGELVAKLKEEDLFDSALVIVTADHGGAFVPGEPHRRPTPATYKEIIATPLLIKLPEQRTGAVDTRPASGLDVVPTIAQVLGAELPWKVDGQSLLAEHFQPRPTTEYAGTSVPPLAAFDVRLEAAHRAALGPDEMYARFIGQPVSDLELDPPTRSIRVLSDAFRAFQNVSAASGFVPALVFGRLDRDTGAPVTLAIAVNGTIAAFVRTLDWRGVKQYFSALVPERMLRDGANKLQFLLAGIAGGRLRLAPIPPDLNDGVTLSTTGETTELITSDGTRLPVSAGMAGAVQRIEERGHSLVLHGWVADSSPDRPPVSVAAFAGDVFIGATAPAGQQPGGSANVDQPAAAAPFSLAIPGDALKQGSLHVFVVSDAAAGELPLSPRLTELLARYR
jgi:hypothetical protein